MSQHTVTELDAEKISTDPSAPLVVDNRNPESGAGNMDSAGSRGKSCIVRAGLQAWRCWKMG